MKSTEAAAREARDLLTELGLTGWQSQTVSLRELHGADLGMHDPTQRITTISRGEASSARHSVVMPVHNQERNIFRVLTDLQSSLSLPHEICVVIDDCSDDSLDEVGRWMSAHASDLTLRMTLVLPERPLFETLCDVVGIALTAAPFIIEVQADMFIRDPAFDGRLLSWFQTLPALLAVSGRGGHDLRQRPRPIRAAKRVIDRLRDHVPGEYSPFTLEYFLGSEIGRTGERISRSTSLRRSDRLFLHETVMRGPLAIRRSLYDRLGGLDPSRFFLGDDDHDLCRRARSEGFAVAYTPVRFDSPLEAGSTRAERTDAQKAVYAEFASYYRDRGAPQTESADTTPRARRILRTRSTSPSRA